MPSFKPITLALLYCLAACQAPPPPTPDYASSHTFTATGYAVSGDFLHFYQQYNAMAPLGAPISPITTAEGWTVQYFEGGRLERHPENEPRYQVTVGWLGVILGRQKPPLPISARPSALSHSRYFPETGHTLSGDFLYYFETHGDTVRFGKPISEPFLVEGQLAQDFQSARFFWQPDHDPPVRLEDIGRVALEQIQTP